MEVDAVEGPADCISRDEAVQVLSTMKTEIANEILDV